MRDHATAFAPATLANLGPGFDVLGLALTDIGDTVTAHRVDGPLCIQSINGDAGRLPMAVHANTAGIAARAVLQCAGLPAEGIALRVHKGLPIGSGLGSSAASAAAAAWAVNALLPTPLPAKTLIEPCLAAEEAVSGRHADNLAPALLGGLVLVRRLDPLDWVRIPTPAGLSVVIVTPGFELKTQAARAALASTVPLPLHVRQSADLAALVAAGYRDDVELFGRALNDVIATPARLPLIPGGAKVLQAARMAGALGAGISGAGPSLFAIVQGDGEAVGTAMRHAFESVQLTATVHSSGLQAPGARLIED